MKNYETLHYKLTDSNGKQLNRIDFSDTNKIEKLIQRLTIQPIIFKESISNIIEEYNKTQEHNIQYTSTIGDLLKGFDGE